MCLTVMSAWQLPAHSMVFVSRVTPGAQPQEASLSQARQGGSARGALGRTGARRPPANVFVCSHVHPD